MFHRKPHKTYRKERCSLLKKRGLTLTLARFLGEISVAVSNNRITYLWLMRQQKQQERFQHRRLGVLSAKKVPSVQNIRSFASCCRESVATYQSQPRPAHSRQLRRRTPYHCLLLSQRCYLLLILRRKLHCSTGQRV